MNKSTFSLLAFVTFALASCTQEKQYTVTCLCPTNIPDSTFAYMVSFKTGVNDVEKIDSTYIINQKAVFKGTTDDSEVCAVILPPYHRNRAIFIKEAGNIKIKGMSAVSGSPLNDAWSNFRDFSDSVNSKAEESYSVIMRNTELSKEEREDQIEELYSDYCNKILDKAGSIIDNHKDDALGQLVFWMDVANNGIMDRFIYKDKISTVGSYISSFGPVKAITKRFEAQEATSEGHMFTDFSIKTGNTDGSIANLSDYAGKGKLLLVDFWASWCGPCRRAMPSIAEAVKAFPADKFEVLSIAVWDKHDDTLKAMQELNMTWNHIIDAETIPTELYGVIGIPHLMLIGADGTILHRGLAPDNIMSVVQQHLAN